MESRLRRLASEMSDSINHWLIEGENEFHPGYDKRYTPELESRRFLLYRKLNRLLPISDVFRGRNVLHVGAGTGAYNFLLRSAGAARLTALEPDRDNFRFLKNSTNIHYDDYINLRLEDIDQLDQRFLDLVFLGNLSGPDWAKAMSLLTTARAITDIVIHSKLFNCEIERTKYIVPEESLTYKSIETKLRYATWDGKEEKEFWSIGEMIRIARSNNFGLVHKDYIQVPVGWCTLVFSRLD